MDVFLTVLENRSPQWNAQIAWLFVISLALLVPTARICGAKKLRLAGIVLLYTYLFNVLVTTLLMREPAEQIRYTLSVNFIRQIFIEHNAFAASEAILNFLLLFPVGLFMPVFFEKFATLKTCVFGFVFSLFIECTQLVTHLGEFQTDDLILNYLGCCAGAWILAAIGFLTRKYSKKSEKINSQ
jgi:glycopeptide antibiotics resistance protein